MTEQKAEWREDTEVFGLVDQLAEQRKAMEYREIIAALRGRAEMDILKDRRRMVGVLRKQEWHTEPGTNRWYPPPPR